MPDRPDPALVDERDFLLRSLDDLDAEHAEGNIDDATYGRLRADYTARAAAVVRRIEGVADVADVAPAAERTRPSPMRRVLTVAGIVAFVAVVAVGLSYALGARLPGETVTGDAAGRDQAARRLADLRADVEAHPDDPDARIALARALLGSDPNGAITQFRRAARLDPTNPEPYAYTGWLVRLQGYPDEALTLLDKAIEVDPRYPDARFFKGVTLLRDRDDPDGAIAELRQYLVIAPDAPLARQVRSLLAEAESAAGGAPTTTTTTT